MRPYQLFVAQGFDRVEPGGLARRIKSKKHSHHGAEQKGFQDLVADAKKKITEISPTDAAAKTESSDAVIVDVREKDEFEESHIPNAVHMSRGMVELEIEDKFPDRNMTIICHCGGGGRSALAAESLQKMGYKNVRSMAGGFKAWKAAGLPTTK